MAAVPLRFVAYKHLPMSRYLGPKHKMCRRLGMKVCDSLKCPAVRRPYKPGQHGPKRQGHLSEYGKQLLEKQKARFMYGVTERQFRRYYAKAVRRRGNTGLALLGFLERRLDNTLFRAGVVPTRRAGRQLVSHGHVVVNSRVNRIASYEVAPSDVISLKERSEQTEIIKTAKRNLAKHHFAGWLKLVQEDPVRIDIIGEPSADDLQVGIDPPLIVEFYSR